MTRIRKEEDTFLTQPMPERVVLHNLGTHHIVASAGCSCLLNLLSTVLM